MSALLSCRQQLSTLTKSQLLDVIEKLLDQPAFADNQDQLLTTAIAQSCIPKPSKKDIVVIEKEALKTDSKKKKRDTFQMSQ
jgi:hypothetical protein